MAIVPGKYSETGGGDGGGGGIGGATFSSATNIGGIRGKGIMLFGVRLMEGGGGGSSFRKSASMNNLAQYDEQPQESNIDAAGYASDDVVHLSARSRERKRGTIHAMIRLQVDPSNNHFIHCLLWLSFCDSFSDFELNRSTVDGGRTPAVSDRITEGRERRLERNFQKLCENTNSDSGG